MLVANDTIILTIAAMKFMTMIYIYILHNYKEVLMVEGTMSILLYFLATIPTHMMCLLTTTMLGHHYIIE